MAFVAWFGKLSAAVGMLLTSLSLWRDHLHRPKVQVRTHAEILEEARRDFERRRMQLRVIAEGRERKP